MNAPHCRPRIEPQLRHVFRPWLTGTLTMLCLWSGAADVVRGAVAGLAAGGKTWHVAPRTLTGIPPNAQLRTVAEAAQKVCPGDLVLIHDGVYRESVVVKQSGTAEKPITFAAAAGEHVVITGADQLRELKKEAGGDNIFSAPWPHRFLSWVRNYAHPGDERHRLIGRCEQAFVSGYPLLQVLERSQLGRGTFYVDLGAKRLYVWARDNADLSQDVLVEASVRPLLWHAQGDHLRLRGVRFRYAANLAQQGAAEFNGNDNLVEDCIFDGTNGQGADFRGQRITVRRCTFQDNGQLGFGATYAHDLLLTGCTVRNNNVKGFNRGWEAGGDKLCLTRKAVLEKCVFAENRGSGVWFDIGNEDCVVRNCLIADNEDAGIFCEISFGLHAHDNVIVGNGFAGTPAAWGGASGIALSSSPHCVIERNLLVGNKEGFNLREQLRSTPLIDDKTSHWVWNHDQIVRNNLLAYNRDAQTWGWFDVDDGRHWPAAMQEDKEKQEGGTPPNIAEHRPPATALAPLHLSLEKLHLKFGQNFYAAQPYQGIFNWGTTWLRNKRYGTLDAVREELHMESGSRMGEARFADCLSRDFRLPPDSPALKMGCYPKGEVPGAVLGTYAK